MLKAARRKGGMEMAEETAEEPRRCAEEGCDTILRTGNTGTLCGPHQRQEDFGPNRKRDSTETKKLPSYTQE